MKLDEVVKVVTEAIQKKLVVEVTYIREEDGVRTCRMMEPFDVAVGKRHKIGRRMFWGWCREHDCIESKAPANIISIRMTDETFEPKIREKTFGSPARYEIKRDWK